MKILIANYEFPPLGGGASKVSFVLAKALVKLGHDVIVLTSRYGDAPAIETVEGIIVHRVWTWRIGVHDCGLRGAITYLMAAFPRLRRILNEEEIDVVHYFFGLPTGLLSIYSHGVKKVPYIVSLRGSDVPLYDRDSRKLMFLHRLTRSISHKIWRNASQVFAVSNGLRKMAEASLPGVNVSVIYNGVDVVDVVDIGKMRNSAKVRNPLRLICVSRLIPRKGIDDLLEALAKVSGINCRLVVIGSGPSEAELKDLAQQRGIAGKVTFAGYCTPAEVHAQYLKSDILVFPTHSDAFANVVLEAMSASLPVIATSVGGIAEAVVDGKTGILINPRRPNELARAIEKLGANNMLRLEYGRAGQQRVREMFTWDINAKLYSRAYADAVKQPA